MKKKHSVILIALMIISVIVTPIYGQSSSESQSQIDFEKYDLEIIDEIPENITPIVINNEEELVNFIRKSRELIDNHSEERIIRFDESNFDLGTRTSQHLTISDSKLVGAARFRVHANITITADPIWFISAVHSTGVSLTGYTVGLSLSDQDSYSVLSADQRSITVYGSATLNYHMIVDGAPVIWANPISHHFTYQL